MNYQEILEKLFDKYEVESYNIDVYKHEFIIQTLISVIFRNRSLKDYLRFNEFRELVNQIKSQENDQEISGLSKIIEAVTEIDKEIVNRTFGIERKLLEKITGRVANTRPKSDIKPWWEI